MQANQCTLDHKNLSLLIHAEIDFDNFAEYAQSLLKNIDCTLVEKNWGADRHQWLLDFEGCRLWLNYEFYTDSCWLHVEKSEDLPVLTFIFQLLSISSGESTYE